MTRDSAKERTREESISNCILVNDSQSLSTTYFRMETLWPHYKDDFMDFLLVNEFFVME